MQVSNLAGNGHFWIGLTCGNCPYAANRAIRFNRWTDGAPLTYSSNLDERTHRLYNNEAMQLYADDGRWNRHMTSERQRYICEERNVCASSPCQNDATCWKESVDRYSCRCLHNFTGVHCEHIFTTPGIVEWGNTEVWGESGVYSNQRNKCPKLQNEF